MTNNSDGINRKLADLRNEYGLALVNGHKHKLRPLKREIKRTVRDIEILEELRRHGFMYCN